jgi:hypothetical protein
MSGARKARRTLLDIQAQRPRPSPEKRPANPRETPRPAAAVTNQVTDREAEARRQRAARIRALDLRVDRDPTHQALTGCTMRITEALAHLPAAVAYRTLHDVTALLPPAVNDTLEEHAACSEAAIAAVAALHPVDAFEAQLAAQIVSGLRALQRLQDTRGHGEAVPDSPIPAPDEVPPRTDIAAEADQYALDHRKRAALIRSLGRLPDKLSLGPLSPDLVHAIVTGTSPVLQALDQPGSAARPADRHAACVNVSPTETRDAGETRRSRP